MPVHPDRLTIARLMAITQRHTAKGTITSEARAQAIAELQAEAAGRTDLLAEHAGISLAFAEVRQGWEAVIGRLRAELAIQAGADETLIPVWLETGRERAAEARSVPFTGG
jgi:hypothetical protein